MLSINLRAFALIPQLPDWVSQIECDYPQKRLVHSQQVDLRGLHLAGERVLIVGGGLTSGHLVVGATNCEAKVQLIVRRQLQEKLFDAEPGWLGPKSDGVTSRLQSRLNQAHST